MRITVLASCQLLGLNTPSYKQRMGKELVWLTLPSLTPFLREVQEERKQEYKEDQKDDAL